MLFYLLIFLKILALYFLHFLSLLLFLMFLLSWFLSFHVFSSLFSVTFHPYTSYGLLSSRFLFPPLHISLFSVFFFLFPWNNSILFCPQRFFFHFLILVFFLLITLGSVATSLDFNLGRTPFDSLSPDIPSCCSLQWPQKSDSLMRSDGHCVSPQLHYDLLEVKYFEQWPTCAPVLKFFREALVACR